MESSKQENELKYSAALHQVVLNLPATCCEYDPLCIVRLPTEHLESGSIPSHIMNSALL